MPDPENPALTQAWSRFDQAAQRTAGVRIASLFDAEPDRLARLTLEAGPLVLDLSKQSWTADGLDACLALARAAGVEAVRDRLFAGEAVNASEDRAVMHPALRAESHQAYSAKGELVTPEVIRGRQRMWSLATDIRRGEVRGATGEAFKAVLHIGIGGSDLGPRLVWEALKPLNPAIDLRFVANVDPSEGAAAMAGLDPATTLVVIVSKTFTTQETLANAEFARAWLRAALGEDGAKSHLVAVSAAPDRAEAFGVDPDRVFAFWDWVGGRYSVWSAVGLSCAIALGWQDGFQAFLAGAAEIDTHFRKAPLERNAPVMLALAQIWNRNGLARGARAVVPYAQRLRLLPAFLQQLEMESNGKRVRVDGSPVARATAPVVFGDAGTNGQHAFFQLLHQGTDVVPVEFVAVAANPDGPAEMQNKLLANVLAQAEALMVGRSEADVVAELVAKATPPDVIATLAPQRAFPGDRPSTLILLDLLTPRALGALLALYEHKTFVEGVIWGINSFDQWGVELGKAMASRILPELEGGPRGPHDPSTSALIDRLG